MKPWSEDIRRHIDFWSQRLAGRNWWPRYVYHFTDVTNAAQIINCGELLCRAEAIQRGLMQADNASPEIIARTSTNRQSLARLYFRPRTPTQYRNEGIRPIGQRELNSHCPIPVFFCFDAFEVLTRDDTQFSNGNLASSSAEIGNDQAFFAAIPFEKVFHHTAFDPSNTVERNAIILHRHAEVLVPKRLTLVPSLKFVVCRSAAERRTLLALLSSTLQAEWQSKIRLDTLGMFERKWAYVEDVVFINDSVSIKFCANATRLGPFHLRFEYQEDGQSVASSVAQQFERLPASLPIQLPNAISGTATLYLDNALAFKGRILSSSLLG